MRRRQSKQPSTTIATSNAKPATAIKMMKVCDSALDEGTTTAAITVDADGLIELDDDACGMLEGCTTLLGSSSRAQPIRPEALS